MAAAALAEQVAQQPAQVQSLCGGALLELLAQLLALLGGHAPEGLTGRLLICSGGTWAANCWWWSRASRSEIPSAAPLLVALQEVLHIAQLLPLGRFPQRVPSNLLATAPTGSGH